MLGLIVSGHFTPVCTVYKFAVKSSSYNLCWDMKCLPAYFFLRDMVHQVQIANEM